MSKPGPKPGRVPVIRIPSSVRPRLFPYASVFEDVVIPIADGFRTARSSEKMKRELRESIEAALMAAVGFVPHPWLLRYGLLLCCYHALVQAAPQKQAAVARARRLLNESFDYYDTEDSQFFL
jgi:hypothetical protein